jgi:hypothetical protein
MGRMEKPQKGLFLLLNMNMISKVNFSGLFPVKHASPVGNNQGYYSAPDDKPVVPVTNQPVKL